MADDRGNDSSGERNGASEKGKHETDIGRDFLHGTSRMRVAIVAERALSSMGDGLWLLSWME